MFGITKANSIADACLEARHYTEYNPWTQEDEAWLCDDCDFEIDVIVNGECK